MARNRSDKTLHQRGMGSIRRRVRKNKDGTESVFYEGRIDSGYSSDGKRHQKSIYGKSRKEVEDKLFELALASRNRTSISTTKISDSDITVSELTEKWISGGINQTCSTLALYQSYVDNYIAPHLGSIKVQELTEEHIKECVRRLQDPNYAIKKPLSAKSVKDVVAFLKTVLQDAVEQKIIAENPCVRVKLPKIRKTPESAKMPSETVIGKLLNAIHGAPHERFYIFLMFFGLRVMEALAIVISDIDFDRMLIHVRFQLRKNLAEPIKPGETLHFKCLKDYEQRDLYFGDQMESLLRAQIQEETEKKRLLGDAWPTSELERGDLLFSGPTGKYLSQSTVYGCFKRLANKIGCPELKQHDLRHVYAMLAIQNGDSIKTVAEHLGHSTPDFTIRVYDYVSNEAKLRSAEKMSETMSSLGAADRKDESKDDNDI